MKPAYLEQVKGNLPAKAQTSTGVFGFLFNLLDLITAFFTLFDLFGGLFGGENTAT